MRIITTIALIGIFAGTVFTIAETDHATHGDTMDHASHAHSEPVARAELTEPGQGAFAALAEVVRVLEADPDTDWSKVDLGGLRAHLVDMDLLVTHAVVTETVLPDGIRSHATGAPATRAALRRMVPAHAAQLAKDDRWRVSVSDADDGVILTVTSPNPADVARIKGLGFFGLMASQDHHRAHHFAMARGEDAHAH